MTHDEFVAAHTHGQVKVAMDPKEAARFLSSRLLLPFVVMPVLGVGVALALIGWIYTGLAIIALGIVVPQLIKRSAPRFLLQQALRDPAAYDDLTKSGLLHVTHAATGTRDS